MMKHILILVLSFFVLICQGYSQHRIKDLFELPLLKSEKETINILQQLASGKKPQVYPNGCYRSCSLEGPFFHPEYKVAGDTCVQALIRFPADAVQYNSFVRDVQARKKPFGVTGSGK
jgi:hypothetical protein